MKNAMKRLVILSVLLVLTALTPAHASEYAVVGGQSATQGEFPSAVALIRAEEPDDMVGQFCGGTAIAPTMILTSAHCFEDVDVSRPADQVRVVSGTVELSQGDAPRSSSAQPQGVRRLGVEVYIHPSFDPVRRLFDIAVLLVDGDLQVPLQPLAPRSYAGPYARDVGVVVGWGRTGEGESRSSSRTNELHQAGVTVTGEEDCRGSYDPPLDLLTHLCAGGEGSMGMPAPDACTGDSGGPLLATDPAQDIRLQVGVTSFGPAVCGVAQPGVYARVSSARTFIDDAAAGRIPATEIQIESSALDAGPAERLEPRRVAPPDQPTTPGSQAIASSRAVFSAANPAELAVIARDDEFSDALAGSSLGFGRGPLLFTGSEGPLDPLTREELRRVMPDGGTVYLLGGILAVPARVEQELSAEGYDVHRLAGRTREETAGVIAAEVVARNGEGTRPPFGTAIVVTSEAWPDAVVAGQLGVWWGFPIILTPPEELHPDARDALLSMDLDRVLVVGGHGAVSAVVVDEVEGLLPADARLFRLAGSSRVDTGVAVATWHRNELRRLGETPPDTVAAVNIRTPLGYAYVLAATPIIGATAGVFLPVEGDAGDVLTLTAREGFCGVGGQPLIIGGPDVISDAITADFGDVAAGINC